MNDRLQRSERAYRLLRDRILSGELASGRRLDMAELARESGSSVTPVRDAIKRLSVEGLVVVAPRKGTIVSPFDGSDVRSLFQFREILESAAGKIAARTLSADELVALADTASQLETSSGPKADAGMDSYLRYLEGDIAFHRAVVRGGRNPHLDRVYESLQWQLTIARAAYPRLYRLAPHRRGEHQAIVSALQQRDPERTVAAISAHISNSMTDLIAAIDRDAGAA